MTIPEKKQFSTSTAILSILALFAAAGCFIRLSWYYESCDVPFQIMTGWGDFRTSVVAPLSAWLTGIVGKPLHYDLMPMRYFACTCYIAAILIGMIPAWQLSRNIDFTLVYAIVALLLFPWCRIMEFEYSWDVYATLLIMTVFALSTSYMLRQKPWKIILAAALAGATMWVRLPSAIVGLVPAIAAAYTASGLRKRIIALMSVTVIYFITAGVLLVAMYGSADTYLEYWAINKISAHSTEFILLQYGSILNNLYLTILICAGIYYVTSKVLLLKKGLPYIWLANLFVSMAIMIQALNLFVWAPLAPLFITLALLSTMFAIKKNQHKPAAIALLMLVASFSAAFWSNIELTRMVVYPFIPVLAWLISTTASKHQLAGIACLCLACVLPTLYSAIHGSIKDGQIWLYSTPEGSFVDGNGHIKGYAIDERFRSQYRRVIERFTPYATDTAYTKAVMRGSEHDFMFEYMFDAKTPVFSNYWDHDTLHYNQAYLKGFNAYIDTLRPPTAILVVHRDMPKPPVAFEYENRYVPVYSDSDFTIVIKPVPGNAD